MQDHISTLKKMQDRHNCKFCGFCEFCGGPASLLRLRLDPAFCPTSLHLQIHQSLSSEQTGVAVVDMKLQAWTQNTNCP